MSALTTAKRLVARVLLLPAVGRGLAVLFRDRLPAHGLRVQTDFAGISPVTKAKLFWGLYEAGEIRAIRAFLRPGLPVVELGGSIGVVSSVLARQISPGGRLVVAEPDPALAALIRRNVALNAPGVDVTVVETAVEYAHAGQPTVTFETGTTNTVGRIAGTAAAGTAAAGTRAAARLATVARTTLADLLAAHGIGPFVLVCDIEGAEAGLFASDAEALAACRQIIIELHATHWQSRPVGIDGLVAQALGHGFTLRDRRGPVCVFERPL